VQAAPSEGADPGASDGGDFTMRTTVDAGSSSDATGPAAASSPAAAPIAGGAPAASPQAEMVQESPMESPTADDSTKIAAPPADAMPAVGTGNAGTADGDAAASDLERTPQTGWLILLVAGVALVLLRPILGRLARR
jgi:hypothetical protein